MSRTTILSRRSGAVMACAAVLQVAIGMPAPPRAGAEGQQYPIEVTISVGKPVWLEAEMPWLYTEYRNVTDQPVAAVLGGAVPHLVNADTGQDLGSPHGPCAPPPRLRVRTLEPGQVARGRQDLWWRKVGRWRVYCEMDRGAVWFTDEADPWPFAGYLTNEILYDIVAVDDGKVTVVYDYPELQVADERSALVTYADFPAAVYSARQRLVEENDWRVMSLTQIATDADPSTLQAKWEKDSGLSILYRHLTHPGVWTHDCPGAAPGYPVDFVVGPDDPAPELRRYFEFSPTGRAYWAVYFKGYVYATVRDALRPGFWTRAWITEEEALNPE